MKSASVILFPVMLFLGADTALANESPWNSKKIKPRMSHEALLKQQQATLPKGEARAVRAKDLQPTGSPEREGGGSLISRSATISSGTHWTIVPRDAILNVPPRYRPRVNGKRSGNLVTWKKFLQLNATWVQVQEVSLDQASGKDPLGEETRRKHRSIGRVVVATFQGGPISVKAPVEQPQAARK